MCGVEGKVDCRGLVICKNKCIKIKVESYLNGDDETLVTKEVPYVFKWCRVCNDEYDIKKEDYERPHFVDYN